ncbi:MAG TPA: molybdopterin-dependent oxidoreductase [Thermoanaerobaculia bacterium]|nr:molybdopterin-dependent oxidoreductase [Thermoanaerobaculia bacterium]
MTEERRTVYRACNLCEAICGLEIEVAGPRILSIRGDADDPFSRGHICPKGVALIDIHDDPNRLRRPLKRSGGEWREIPWDEAFDLAASRIAAIQQAHGNDAVGFYSGNPVVHNAGTLFSIPALARALRTKNAFSASSVDQLPHQLASLLMYGHQLLIPIPDIDRTHYLLMLGANPLASNGSLMTAPDVKRRLQAIRERGGKIVLVDPRRTETAAVADEHHFIRPASDAALLMALINTIRDEGRMRVPERVTGLEEALEAIRDGTAEVAEARTGIAAETIRRIAREFAAAPSAVCYGRVGTSLQAFGTLNQWLVQLLNLVTGNLDREGGALVTRPLVPVTGPGTRPGHHARFHSRVSGRPESGGELPVAVLSEEILTPGPGQIRGFITIAGNPVLSTPDGRRLDEALASLEFLLAIDIYLNETTRRADLILPPASSLSHDHYDLIFNAFAIRNTARFNEAIWPRAEDERYDWEIFHELSTRLGGKPVPSTADALASMLTRSGSSLETLRAAPHGLDLGPLAPSLFERLETPDGRIQCAPAPILADVARFHASSANGAFLLIGRRHLRSNNSWMHHSQRLNRGHARDRLMMHPEDLSSLGIADGAMVEVRSRAGTVRAVVQATNDVMRGVVSLPHGFGHVSYNDLTDANEVDAVSGNAALNGTRVEIAALQAG